MSDLLYRYPRGMLLALLLIIVTGFSASSLLPRLEDPKTATRMAFVVTRYPGADAEQVESQVTQRIEARIREMPFVRSVDSWSMVGVSVALVRLTDQCRNVETAWSQLRDKLSDVAAELPEGALSPQFDDSAWGAESLVLGLRWTDSSPADQSILLRLADELASRLRYTPSTKRVQLFGAAEERILIDADATQIAALGLTASHIARVVGQSDPTIPAAPLRTSHSELLIDVTGKINSLEHLRRIPLCQSPTGGVVRLGDVARVTRGVQDPPSSLVLIAGQPGVALAVRLEDDARIDHWRAVVQQELDAFQHQLPGNVGLHVLYDENRHTSERLGGLYSSFYSSLALVALVVVLMLGWKSVLPVCMGMPLTALFVLAGMACWGVSIDQMSVTGLILSMGLLIDNPLIVVDAVVEKLRSGVAPEQAVSRTVHSLWIPLLCSTLTTMLAFMPLLLLPGGVGEFLGNLGITVQLALIGSLVLSLTMVPALAVYVHHWFSRSGRTTTLGFGISSPRLMSVYRGSVEVALAHPWWTLLTTAAMCFAGLAVGACLEEQFFPPADRDEFAITLRLPCQSSLQRTEDCAQAAGKLMLKHPQIADVHWFIGTSAPKVHYSMVGTERELPFYAQALVILVPGCDRQQVISEIQTQLDNAFPNVQAIASQIEQGPPSIAPIELRLYGPDLLRLQRLGDEARRILSTTPGIIHVRQTLATDMPSLELMVLEDEVRLSGMTHESLVGQLSGNLRGASGGSLLEADRKLPVQVRLSGEKGDGLAQLMSLQVIPDHRSSTAASPIPVSALAQVRAVPELSCITRRNAMRTNTVQGYVSAGVSPMQVEAKFRRALEENGFQLPAGYRCDFGGVSAERNTAQTNLAAHFAVLSAMMAASVVLAFNSFRMASVIGGVALISLGFGIGSLWSLNYPLGMTAIVGLMGMIGVAINDSIVVLAAIREDQRARTGNHEAITDVVVGQTRHVLATTFTTVAGALPLLWSGGAMWAPLAAVMIGGISGATVVALHVVPSAYVLILGRAATESRTTAGERAHTPRCPRPTDSLVDVEPQLQQDDYALVT